MIEKLKNLKLVFKTTIILATVLGTMLLCINIFSAIYTRTIVISKVNEQLENSLHEVINTITLYDKLLENTTQSLFNTFESTFQNIEIEENQTILVKGVQTPLLSDNGIMLNNNEMYVDDYASLEGATATIFVRNKDNFTRIATSLKKEDGSRSTGTNLSKNSAAYHAIMNKKQYVGTATLFGKEYMTIYKPIIKNDKIIGILYVGFDYTKSFQELLTNLKKIKIGKSGYLYVLSTFTKNKGEFIIHPLFQNKNISDYNQYLFKNIFLSNKGIINYNWEGMEKEAIYEDYPSRHWKIVLGSNKNEFLEESDQFSIILAIISIIAILIINACIFFIIKKIIIFPLNNLQTGLNDFFNFLNGENKKINEIPIQSNDEIGLMSKLINHNIKESEQNIEIDNQLIMNTTQVANQVNEGILTARIEKSSNNEMLNNLKNVINEMLANTEGNINNVQNVLSEFAHYDFTKKADISTVKADMKKLYEDVNFLGESTSKMLLDNFHTGNNLNDNSKRLTQIIQKLSNSSNEQAASLEQTAASIEELTSTMNNNEDSMNNMSDKSNELIKSITSGQELANETARSMDLINEQTTSIAEAITVIDQIAFQTNILSLNAAVEAATAGEAGKGFAVVAQEVRNLASRSAEAAKEIKDLVENATVKANEGKNIANEMIDGYEDLNTNVHSTTQIIKDVTASFKEQVYGISQINDAVSSLDKITQENANIANNANEIAQDTNEASTKMLNDVNQKNFEGKTSK